jgi:hypothetical protein
MQDIDKLLKRIWLTGSVETITSMRDIVDPDTGMTALHVAVGRGNLELTKALVEAGAKFIPDRQGRMPTYIAAEMEVDEALQDFIVEAEAKAVGPESEEGV